ncbi:MAG: XRE family transcriptional regulator [Bacillota bacterium]
MRIDEQIKTLCAKTDLTAAEIAKRMNVTPQAFSQKMKRGSFSLEDLDAVAMVAGCKIECDFVLPNGEKIKLK